MIRYRLTIEDCFGSPLATYNVEGEVTSITVSLPGLASPQWDALGCRLRDLGHFTEESHIAIGPLLRFRMERIDYPDE